MSTSNKTLKKYSFLSTLFDKKFRNVLRGILLLSFLILIAFSTYINHSFNRIESEHFQELQLVAKLKVKQINHWLTEHENHLSLLKSSNILVTLLREQTTEAEFSINRLLSAHIKTLGLSGIKIQDKQGNTVISTGEPINNNKVLEQAIKQALFTSDIQNTGLYRASMNNDEGIKFNIVSTFNDDNEFVIILSLNKDDFLFPLIEEWPNQSHGSEALLFKKENQGVRFLNDLKYEENTALTRTEQKENADVLAIKIVNNEVSTNTFMSGIDYRGEPVVGVALYIPKLDWYLIAKMDKTEIYTDYHDVIIWEGLTLVSIILSLFAFVFIYIQSKVLHDAALTERDLANSSLEHIFEVIPDLYFKLSNHAVILDYRAESIGNLYVDPSQFIGKKMQDVLPASAGDIFNENIDKLNRTKSMVTFEYELAIGERLQFFDARMSLLPDNYIVLLVRDITEKQNAQKALFQANLVIKKSRVVLFRWKYTQGRPVEYVSENVNQFGYSQQDLTSGKVPYSSIIHPNDIDEVIRNNKHCFDENIDDFSQEYRIVSPSGQVFYVDVRTQIVRDKNGEITYSQGTVIDRTDKKLLAKQVSYYNRLFESSMHEIYIFNGDTLRLIEANYGALQNTGYTFDEITALSFVDIKPEYSSQDFHKVLDALNGATHKKFVRTCIHQRKDGSTYPVETHIELIDEESNSYIALVHDITQREKSHNIIKESEEKLTNITNSVNDAIVMVDEFGCVNFWNTGAKTLFGYSFSQIFSKNIIELIIPENKIKYLSRCYFYLTRSKESKIFSRTLEIKALNIEKNEIDIELSLSQLASNGKRYVIAVCRDISRRKTMEQKLLQLGQAVEQGSGSVIITDLSGSIEYVNKSFTKNTGYSLDDVKGKSPRLLQSDNTPPDAYDNLWETLNQGKTWSGTFYNKRKDGSKFVEFAIISPLRQPDGTVTHYVTVTEDITEKQALGHELDEYRNGLERLVETRTAELYDAKISADKANNAKSEFLANMSHEIRTPMNAIIGLSHILSRSEVNSTQQDQLFKIDSAANHLLSIINDIIDLSKIESRHLVIEHVDFAVKKVFDNLANILTIQAKTKGLNLIFTLTDVPSWVRGDVTRIQQALMNYLSNAIKFSRDGDITVNAKVLETKVNELFIEFSVADQGCGIKPENLNHIFKAFQQEDSSTTRRFGGSGLGLTITEQLANLMGGQVGVESEVGKGSRFWFTAWLSVGEETHEQNTNINLNEQVIKDFYQGANILVVEDNDINAEVAELLLTSIGLHVDIAENGQLAVEKVNNKKFDLILMDIQMPVMDGLQATQLIRQKHDKESLPILAMSASVFNENRQECFDIGMNDFVAKPVSPKNLFSKIIKWLPNQEYHNSVLESEALDSQVLAHEKSTIAALKNLSLIQVDNGLANCAGNVNNYLKLLIKFDEMQVSELAKLKEQLSSGLFDDMKHGLHALKGVSGNLGLDNIYQTINKIEARIGVNKSNEFDGLLKGLTSDLDRFSQKLNELDLPSFTQERLQAKTPQHSVNITEVSDKLRILLSKDSADANIYFDTVSDDLFNTYGTQVEILKEHINNFDYLLALDALSSLSKS